MKTGLVIKSMFLILGLSTSAHAACGGSAGWKVADAKALAISVEEVIANAKSELNVTIEKSTSIAKCGNDDEFEVKDASSNAVLGNIPVPRSEVNEKDGRTLQVRLNQLMKTSRAQLASLQIARESFFEDAKALEEDLGISAYVPNALPIEQRITEKGLVVYVILEEMCNREGTISPGTVSREADVRTFEYIPGRTDYSPGTVYRPGELKRMILDNAQLLEAIRNAVHDNTIYCRKSSYKTVSWSEVETRLADAHSALLGNAVLRFVDAMKSHEYRVKSAGMLNARRIEVDFQSKSEQFVGTVAEMVAIQRILKKSNVTVDKKNRLTFIGKMQAEGDVRYKVKVPESLRD